MWLPLTNGRIQLAHVVRLEVSGSAAPFAVSAGTVDGQTQALRGPQAGYATVAEASAAIDALLLGGPH